MERTWRASGGWARARVSDGIRIRMPVAREYTHILSQTRPIPDRSAAMAHLVDLLWREFGEDDPTKPTRGHISWVGFYEIEPGEEEMALVCREPKPACSPIGLHGMCGRGWKERRSYVVRDVAVLGDGYVACDPRDRSELVVPMIVGGECWGVLDVDSYDVGAFAERDAQNMGEVCRLMGLTEAVAPCVLL